MLQALIHKKIDRWMPNKNPWEIEDLLTAVVFGSCKYAGIDGWEQGLRPFLAAAINSGIKTSATCLNSKLPPQGTVKNIEYLFWPALSEFAIEMETGNSVAINKAIPEVIIILTTEDDWKYYILVEVKLNISKSSYPSLDHLLISDQLAKYWIHLKEKAKLESGKAVAIVYLTPNVSFPRDDIEESKTELMKVGDHDPPIFWISWRQFVPEVEALTNIRELPPIIQDVIILLSDQWGLVYFKIEPWPALKHIELEEIFIFRFLWPHNSDYLTFNYCDKFIWRLFNYLSEPKKYKHAIYWSKYINTTNKWSIIN
jgi:hypothetical protein